MIIITARIWCDAYKYKDLHGNGLPRCNEEFTEQINFDALRTEVRRIAKEHGWWRDPESPPYYPRNLCPKCRKMMLGRA